MWKQAGMRQHLDIIYEAAPGHGPGRRNVRLGYKVSKKRPQSKSLHRPGPERIAFINKGAKRRIF